MEEGDDGFGDAAGASSGSNFKLREVNASPARRTGDHPFTLTIHKMDTSSPMFGPMKRRTGKATIIKAENVEDEESF